ncbi:hypothetical protein F0P96_01005 [Hymenobacter busanensis]|uniref:Uncharacterized protein n=1 Tax=Hymenobacter busanensis TaxID=2607656 RepID=A0A7L4ZVK2_9BACT|nr:hypothetical protein [Hymenobacter busanensis]KAA9339235.1 hypothetical protein F0P96_01005 [Hymenobacter busanensis]QHJ07003.1 hypothetical protein GUY19_06745 [Hymenobacter busanensis]
MRSVCKKVLVMLTAFVGLETSAEAQVPADKSLLINGKQTAVTSCLPLAELRTVSLPKLAGDSLAVELYLIRGRIPIGRNYFNSVAAFNSTDLLAWLKLEKPTDELYLKDRRAVAPLRRVYPGDRVLILVGKGSNLPENGFRYSYNLQLCDD